MLSWRNVASVAALCAALGFASAPPALAQSAGNQQYVDPLSQTTTTSSAAPSTQSSSPQPSTSSAPSASSGANTSATSASSASDSPSTTTAAAAPSSKDTLPFTGLDLWPAVAVGVALVASGLGLRRIVARRS